MPRRRRRRRHRRQKRLVRIAALSAAVLTAAIAVYLLTRNSGLPSFGSEAYLETNRLFHVGLANLQVGQADAAKTQFTAATALAPGEPTIWANLGLADVRLGNFEAAVPAIDRASRLAPANSRVAFLQGRLAAVRGDRDAAIRLLRRAVDLDPRNLRAQTALAREVEETGEGGSAEVQRLTEAILSLAPDNTFVLLTRAQRAARRRDAPTLRDSFVRLEPFAQAWPPEAAEPFASASRAGGLADFAEASRALGLLGEQLARVPTYVEDRRRASPPEEGIAEPFTQFLRLAPPVAEPSAPDDDLAFAAATLDVPDGMWTALTAFSPDGEQAPVAWVSNGQEIVRVGEPAVRLAFPGGGQGVAPPHGLLAIDWNHDFRLDLFAAGPAGVRLFLQTSAGAFVDATSAASGRSGPVLIDATGAWAADIGLDGRLDVVVGVRDSSPVVLENRPDGSWDRQEPFTGVRGLESFVWGDLDADGDPDAALVDQDGGLHVFASLSSGPPVRIPSPLGLGTLRALALGDVDANGALDLIMLDQAGAFRRMSLGQGVWTQDPWTVWPEASGAMTTDWTPARLSLADLDNNGALDLVASDASGAGIWLADETRTLRRHGAAISADVRNLVDLDGDGRLDLVGLSSGRPVRLSGQRTLDYHYALIRPRAQAATNDGIVPTFGTGGTVEVRSGLLVQQRVIAGTAVRVGLGTRTNIDVLRITWPNGVSQAEFDPTIDQPVIVEQRSQ